MTPAKGRPASTATVPAIGMVNGIPDGTEVLGVDISDGVATVDLSEEFASGGGSLSMQLRVAQVVFTSTGATSRTSRHPSW